MEHALILLRNGQTGFRGAFRKIADFILQDLNAFVRLDIRGVAEGAGVAQSSVVRFYHSLGFQTFADFKVDIARNLEENPVSDITFHGDEKCRTILNTTTMYSIRAIQDSMAALDFDVVEKVVEQMLAADRVIFYGIGTSAVLVNDIYYRLMRVGLNAFFATDPHIMRTTANQLTPRSLAFGISYTGRSRDTIRTLQIAKERGAATVCLTAFRDSPICQVSDYKIICLSNEIRLSGEAYANTLAQKNILDGIYNCIAPRISDEENRSRLHNILEEVRYPR